jgi:hypothetical protein
MAFSKTAQVEVLGVFDKKDRQSFNKKIASKYVEANISAIPFEDILDNVADTYKISRNLDDYILVPCRALTANIPNENLDAFPLDVLREFNPSFGCRRYQTFNMKPHYVNHNSGNYSVSRGVILDSSLNGENRASDQVKRAVFESTGLVPEYDVFTELLIAVDTTKDRSLSDGYKSGSVRKFSMGCSCEHVQCSIPECGKVATNDYEMCKHVKSKHARVPIKCQDGIYRVAFEWVLDPVFEEISAVHQPADITAEVQDGLLEFGAYGKKLYASLENLNEIDLKEMTTFILKYSKSMPDKVAEILNNILDRNSR